MKTKVIINYPSGRQLIRERKQYFQEYPLYPAKNNFSYFNNCDEIIPEDISKLKEYNNENKIRLSKILKK